jgi:uncharacterized protein
VLVIDLRRLEQAPAEVRGEISGADPVWSGSGLDLAGPVVVRARADGSPTRGVRVRGLLQGRLRSQCRRCLEPLELEVTDDFDLFFDPKSSATDEDMTLHTLEPRAEELDLRGPLGERFVLVAPDFPVCREECMGLCPHCGVNRNETDCDCSTVEPDSRWGPLQQLKKR